MELSQTAKHELAKGMDDVLFEEMFNDFQEHDNIPLACNSLPNKSDSTTACSITTASDSPLNTNSISTTTESLVNDPNLSPALLSPGIDLPHDIANFIDNIPVATDNTKLNYRTKTEGHIRLFTQFLMVNNYTREMNTISAIVDVRQKNGEEYEPSYIRGMLGSFERHLKRKNYGISLISGYEFYKARDVLTCKQKDLKKKGKGNLPMRAEPLTDTDINTHFYKELLGKKTASSLLNNMWYLNTLHFGIRGGGEDHRGLKCAT